MAQTRISLPHPPAAVLAALREHAVVATPAWLPKMSQAKAWRESSAPLYLVEGTRRYEVGPKVPSLNAARFFPVLAFTLTPSGEGTVLEGTLRLPIYSQAILWLWTIILVFWGASVLPEVESGALPAVWAVVWGLFAAITVALPLVSLTLGAGHTREKMALLPELLANPPLAEEDW